MRRFALALLVAALLAPALPPASAALPPGGMFGGEFRVALPAAPDLDPLQFASNRLVQQAAYDPLTRLGMDHLPVPWLASSWTIDAPGGTITMDLRAAVWPDASAITANDVAWSFGKYLAASRASGFTVTTVDADTVRFTFASGGGDFLGNAATLPVAWKSGSDAPTTNGPFVARSQTAARLELGANLLHWNGRPYLDRLVFQSPYALVRNPDGTTQGNDAACALLKGDVHLIGWAVIQTELTTERDCVANWGGWSDGTNRTLLNPDPARTMPHVGIAENPGLRFLYLGMNTRRAPLNDPVFRQALSRAIDRDLVAGTFSLPIEPKTDIADSVVSPANLAWFNESVPRYRVERRVVGGTAVPTLEPVNAFLNDAGYLDRDGDGWRDRPGGAPFNFTVLTLDQRADPRVAKYLDLITKFHAIGVNVVQREKTPADLRADVAAGAFDLYVDTQEVVGEPAFLYELFHTLGSRNLVGVSSPALDAILDRVRGALDPSVRGQAVLDAQGWTTENAPLAPIVHQRALHAYDRTAFEGWVSGLGGIANFWTLTAVHVTQHGPLTVLVEALQPSIRVGSATTVLVRVRDASDDGVAGVELELGGTGLAATNGVTDAEGRFETTFTAPAVAEPQEFRITANAAKPGYGSAGGAGMVTVHPVARSFLVSLSKGSPTLLSGNSTFVRVIVIDEGDASPLAGVAVEFTAKPDGAGESFAQAAGTTDANGMFETTFTASVTVTSRFLIRARVTSVGYEEAGATTSIEVSPRPGGGAPPTPALDTVSMVALVAALAALYGAWQRRKWTARKR